MPVTLSETTLIALVVGAVLIIGLVVWLALSRRRNDRLESKYGPEYRRLVEGTNAREAAREFSRREKRLELLNIRPLTDPERNGFAADWQRTQTRFVDDPPGAVTEADRLVGALMTARGYPVADFDQRAADISVDHPLVVEHYRAAHDFAIRQNEGRATTEDLRQALVHYRALFSELLEERAPVR